MKVYVDELPKSCEDCVCHDGVNGRCKLLHRTTFDIPPKDCPLQTIADHDKQVRKEVCEDLYNKCVEKIWTNDEGFDCVDIDNIKDILDQIEKGEINENNKETSI